MKTLTAFGNKVINDPYIFVQLLVVPALPSKTWTLDYLISIINDQISIMIIIK